MPDGPLLVIRNQLITSIIINRPERRNTLSAEVLRALAEAMGRVGTDGTRVVILRGAGEQTFCAGYDLSALPATVPDYSDRVDRGQGITPEENLIATAVDAVAGCPVPVIAMIYGPCVGAGCDLAAACDIRLAARTARFAVPAVRRGLTYPPESTNRLIRLVGIAAASEMLLTGQFIDALRAQEIGLVSRVHDTSELAGAVASLADELAANGPLALVATKRIIGRCVELGRLPTAEEALLQELATGCVRSSDFQEGRRAFLEKRRPNFQGK